MKLTLIKTEIYKDCRINIYSHSVLPFGESLIKTKYFPVIAHPEISHPVNHVSTNDWTSVEEALNQAQTIINDIVEN